MTEKVVQFTDKEWAGGGGGLKAEVLAGLVKDYKALVVAHDLFMTDWDSVVLGSWKLNGAAVLKMVAEKQLKKT